MLIHELFQNKFFKIYFAGFFTAFAFAPVFAFPCIVCLSMLVHYIQQNNTTKWDKFKYGWAFGFGYFTSGLYWISISATVYMSEFWWSIPFILFAFPACLGIFIGLVALFSAPFKDSHNFPIIFAIIWTLFEWVRSWIFSGFPWNLLGYTASVSVYLIQTASIWGVYGLSIIICFVGCGFSSKNILKHSMTSIVILISLFSFGYYRLQKHPTTFSQYKFRLVQPSLEQEVKWSEKIFFENFEKYIKLSITPSEKEPDFIIWPETAITVPISIPIVLNMTLKVFENFKNTTLITGGITINDNRIFNSLYTIDKNGNIISNYNKVHLVPFAEYVPFKFIAKKIMKGFVDYSRGVSGQVFNLGNIKIRPLICYEIIFPDEVRKHSVIPDVIVNVTNDAWYKNSSGPYQHFYIAQMRAVENGIPVIRSANNGISGFIDPLGRILARTKLNEITSLDNLLPNKLLGNMYIVLGNLGVLISLVFVKLIQLFCKTLPKSLMNKLS